MAATFIIGDACDAEDIEHCTALQNFPSLCFAFGRELMSGENLNVNLKEAYLFLKHAEAGYRLELANGNGMYKKAYDCVVELLKDLRFNTFAEAFDGNSSDSRQSTPNIN